MSEGGAMEVKSQKSILRLRSGLMVSEAEPSKVKTTTKTVKFFLILVSFIFYLFTLAGCETIWEGAKGFSGVSTTALEDNRKTAVTKTFNYDYSACYTKTLNILKGMEAYIYTQSIKKHMIAIYISEQDTTPVGLFFKEIDAANTQIEVSSQSTYAKEFISGGVFSVLDKKTTLEELEAQINAKKEAGNK